MVMCEGHSFGDEGSVYGMASHPRAGTIGDEFALRDSPLGTIALRKMKTC